MYNKFIQHHHQQTKNKKYHITQTLRQQKVLKNQKLKTTQLHQHIAQHIYKDIVVKKMNNNEYFQ